MKPVAEKKSVYEECAAFLTSSTQESRHWVATHFTSRTPNLKKGLLVLVVVSKKEALMPPKMVGVFHFPAVGCCSTFPLLACRPLFSLSDEHFVAGSVLSS